jgi:pimeloyl-ACP methyl ester carboxylesterase
VARPNRSAIKTAQRDDRPTAVAIPPLGLPGLLRLPADARGIVIFAHGSGSGRLSPRNNYVAEALGKSGIATLLLDLLTVAEEADRANVFDISLLADRLANAIQWVLTQERTAELPIGLFGASTGAAAALVAASRFATTAKAVVSRGGRPDLADAALALVTAPTLLIIGGADIEVLRLNRSALARLAGPAELVIVPGATHLFPEPGALDAVIDAASAWFLRHFGSTAGAEHGR